MVIRDRNVDLARVVGAGKVLVMLFGASALVWIIWTMFGPSSPLQVTLVDHEQLTSREAALTEADRLSDDWIVQRLKISGLTSMPSEEVQAIFGRLAAMRKVTSTGCNVEIDSDASEFDLRFASEIVERAGKGKLCVPNDAAVFAGYTLKQARVRGIKVPKSIKSI